MKELQNKTGKLSLIIAIIVIFILAGLFLVSYSVNKTIDAMYSENLKEMADHDKKTVSIRLNTYWDTINNVVEDVRTWYNYDGTDVLKLLNTDCNMIPNIYKLALLADDGTYYRSTGVVEYRPELVGYCKKHAGRSVTTPEKTEFFSFEESQKEILMFVAPIDAFRAEGHIFTHVFCSVLVSGLEKEFTIPSFQGEGWSCIVDADGNFLVHIHRAQATFETMNIYEILSQDTKKGVAYTADLKKKLETSTKSVPIKAKISVEKGKNPEWAYILFTPVPESDWNLVSVTPTKIYRKQTIKILLITAILLILIVITFFTIILMVLKQRKNQQDFSNQILQRFSQSYTSVYLVNADNNSYKILKRNEYLKRNYPQELSFTSSIDKYITRDVYEPDRQVLREATRFEYILGRLKNEDKFTVPYRDISGKKAEPRWYEMTVARLEGEKDSYLMGFADNHDKMLENFIQEKMYDSYRAVFYVNLVTDTYKNLKDASGSAIMQSNNGKSWSKSIAEYIVANCDEISQDAMLGTIADVKQLKKNINAEHHLEYIYKWKDGENFWQRITIHAFERNHDDITSVIIGASVLDDFSAERQKLSSQLQMALENAEAANKAKTQFLNSMSHDIRTPMNAILGFTDIAKKHIGDEKKVSESLEKVSSAGEHLLSLINDVLDMSRIESGTVEITPVPCNLPSVTKEIGPIFEGLANDKNIEFTVDIDGIKDPDVMIDRLRMSQIIINVVSNAIKYTNAGGKVNVTAVQKECSREGFGTYVFTVKDNGIGMSKEFQKHIFETFSREETASVSKREGTGLGLSIVKRLVDLMGGTITVESEQGKGSTFVIQFDFEITHSPTFEEKIGEEIRQIENLKGKRILLVDDNDFNREIARENLEDEGVIVEEAVNGADALEKVSLAGGFYFDCVLMDVQMPVMNGYEATKAIRKLGTEFAKLPIIALSANAFEEDKNLSKEAGMSAHLSKPIRIKQLLETLNSFV